MKDENSRLRCCLISGMTALIPFCSYVTVLKKKLMMPPPLLFLPKSASAEVLVYIKFLKEGTNLRQQHRVNCFYMSLCSQLPNIQKTKNNKWVKYIYIFFYICIYFILYIYYFILYIYKRIYIYPLMYKTTYIKNKTKHHLVYYLVFYSWFQQQHYVSIGSPCKKVMALELQPTTESSVHVSLGVAGRK